MANKHYNVDRDYEINLKIKLKVKMLSNYHSLSEEDIEQILDGLQENFEEEFRWKIEQMHRLEDPSSVDYVYFEIQD